MLKCKTEKGDINLCETKYDRNKLKNMSNNNMLLCPACGKLYEYCHGSIKIPYFRHKDKEECFAMYSESETQEHLMGKTDLYNWLLTLDGLEDIILEGWIEETKQRPDIMFKYNNNQYVIEFQCTPISSEYFERHELYQSIGIKDIWICGTEKYFQCFHKGNGAKGINILEENCRKYYDYKNKNLYTLELLDKKRFKEIDKKKKKHDNLMESIDDYKDGKNNYYYVKKITKSYDSYSHYPSPTGRPSNKYPYPVTEYEYNMNKSIATCNKMKDVRVCNIM